MLSPSSPISAAALYTNDIDVAHGAHRAGAEERVVGAHRDQPPHRRFVEVEAVVPHEEVQAGGVAAAHLEPVDRRQRDLDREERLDGGDRRVGAGEGADLRRGAEAVAADRPHRVARPHQRRVHPFQVGGRQRRAETAVEVGLHPVEPGGQLVDAVADEEGGLGIAQQGPDAGHAPQLSVDPLDPRRRAAERVGEVTVRCAGVGRGEHVIEPAHQRRRVRHRARRVAADDPDDATHGRKG